MAYEAAEIIKECEEKAQKFKNEALEKARQQAADAKMRVQELMDESKKQASDETGKIIDEAHRMAENYIKEYEEKNSEALSEFSKSALSKQEVAADGLIEFLFFGKEG